MSTARDHRADIAPWWRAADILKGAEVELAAVVLDELWRRRDEVRCSGEHFGWGQDVTVELPEVDVASVQHKTFGWTAQWPLPQVLTLQVTLGDPSVSKLLWDVAGRPADYEESTFDLESWERVSGLTETELFPERTEVTHPPVATAALDRQR